MTSPATVDHSPVELRMRASLAQLPVLRAAAGSLAMLADFDVDAVADIRLVADEVCSMVIGAAVADTEFRCVLAVRGDRFEVTASARSVCTVDSLNGTLGWRIVGELTESLHGWTSTTADGTELLHITACVPETGPEIDQETD